MFLGNHEPARSFPRRNQVGFFENGLLAHLRGKHAGLLEHITNDDPKIKGEVEDKIRSALDEYAADFA